MRGCDGTAALSDGFVSVGLEVLLVLVSLLGVFCSVAGDAAAGREALDDGAPPEGLVGGGVLMPLGGSFGEAILI
jgi:hypothetical protein